MQQWVILRESGEKNPDPIKHFYQDIQKQLQEWKQQGSEILLMIDANEQIGEKPGGLTSVMGKLGLTELVRHIHPNSQEPNTHIRGSHRIDYIFGTTRVRDNCFKAGILPFGTGYQSDHRAIFVTINMENILSSKITATDTITARKLQQATPRERELFLREVNRYYENQNIYQRLKELQADDETWTEDNKKEYEWCDQIMIHGMLLAEQQTRKLKTTPWSPLFGKAVNKKSFWKTALSLKINCTRPNEEFVKWAESLGIENIRSTNIQTIKKNLRTAQKELYEIEKQADSLREAHLREMLTAAELSGDENKVQKRLKVLLRSHTQRQHFSRLKNIFKPKAAGGLSYILVPKNFTIKQYPYDPAKTKEWESIHDHDELQSFIQHRNIKHFGQAHGTPFTVPPLDKIQWQADSIEAQEIINGSVPIEFLSENPYTERILQYIAKRDTLPTIDTMISAEQVSRGFRKWRENTSTSPSGCHLGLRRITTYPAADEETEEVRKQILQAQTDIINIPIQKGFSPHRWQTVVNAMLEKIPGKPYLHKLRVIHILEADYNLALKEIFGRRLMWNSEQNGKLGDIQDGFRKGRSTIQTLLHNEIINDYNKRLRINNFIGITDISGCFDRIVSPVILLLNRKNGCTKEAVAMHATTLKNA
jgi:hypothetical protein